MKRAPANRCYCFVLLTSACLAWDLYSKSSVFDQLGYEGRSSEWVYEWLGGWLTFRLFTSFNEGALWGFGQGYAWAFAALSVFVAAPKCGAIVVTELNAELDPDGYHTARLVRGLKEAISARK